MYILDNTSRRLRIFLGGPGIIPFTASYVDISMTSQALSDEFNRSGFTAGPSPVDLVPSPNGAIRRQVKHIHIANTSGASQLMTIRYADGGINRDFPIVLQNGDWAEWKDPEGWRFFDITGNMKTSGGGSSTFVPPSPTPGSLTTITNMLALYSSTVDSYALRKVTHERFRRRV